MAGNSIGQLFRVTTCGESHGVGLMAIVDGVPPGQGRDERVSERAPHRRRVRQQRRVDPPLPRAGVDSDDRHLVEGAVTDPFDSHRCHLLPASLRLVRPLSRGARDPLR